MIIHHFRTKLLVHISMIQSNPSHHAKLSPTVAEQGTVRNASTSVTAMVAARWPTLRGGLLCEMTIYFYAFIQEYWNTIYYFFLKTGGQAQQKGVAPATATQAAVGLTRARIAPADAISKMALDQDQKSQISWMHMVRLFIYLCQ